MLLRKLGMSHSTFDQPLPRDWDSLESFVQEISIRRVGVMAKTKRELREVEREPVEKTPTHEEIAHVLMPSMRLVVGKMDTIWPTGFTPRTNF